jgi:hypothetical protein
MKVKTKEKMKNVNQYYLERQGPHVSYKTIYLQEGNNYIGCYKFAMSIQINSPLLKKSHCNIGLQDNHLWIENFGTATTFVSHKKVTWLERICPGMRISLGGSNVMDPNIFVGILRKKTSGSSLKTMYAEADDEIPDLKKEIERLKAQAEYLKAQDETRNLICNICCDRKRETAFHCGHFYCRPCVDEWMKISVLCPECKQEIKKVITIFFN